MTQADSSGLNPEQELPAAEPAEVAGEELRRLQAERDLLHDRLLRTLADADNARKRAARELQEARQRGAAEALRPFLEVLDASERALEHLGAAEPGGPGSGREAAALRTGVELLHRQLFDAARKAGLQPLEAMHQPFDPHQHEALEAVETDTVPEGTVVAELQRGYKLHERLLRPAMVKVARAKA